MPEKAVVVSMSETPLDELNRVIQRYKEFHAEYPAEIFAGPTAIRGLGTIKGQPITKVSGVKLTICMICPDDSFYAFNEEDAEKVRQQENAVVREILERAVGR